MGLMNLGDILIILAGRFKGKRVIFLRKIARGILVTGPSEINGVPICQINNAFVLTTTFKLDLSRVDLSQLDKTVHKFFGSKNFDQLIDDRHKTIKQSDFIRDLKNERKKLDTVIIARIEATPGLSSYLSASFTLKTGIKPHLLKF